MQAHVHIQGLNIHTRAHTCVCVADNIYIYIIPAT